MLTVNTSKTIPTLTNDPAAFTRLTNYVQSMSLRAVDAHNAAADRLHATKGLSPDLIGMNYRIEVPSGDCSSAMQSSFYCRRARHRSVNSFVIWGIWTNGRHRKSSCAGFRRWRSADAAPQDDLAKASASLPPAC